MEKREMSHLGKMFVATFILSAIPIFGVQKFFGFEIALLFSICWLCAVVAATSVGIENVIKGAN